MRMAHKRYNFCSGFTLIEILISLVILVVTMVSIYSLFVVAGRSQKRSVEHIALSSIAEKIIFAIQSNLYTDKPRDINSGRLKEQGIEYIYDVSYKPIDENRNGFLVKIIIRWNVKGKEDTKVFETVVLKKMDLDKF